MLIRKALLGTIIVGAMVAAFATNADAAAPGPYAGLQLGYANTHYSGGNISAPASVDNTGLAGRLFGGYQFDDTWAGEMGVTKLSNTTFKNIAGLGINRSLKEYAIDAMAKAMIPVGDSGNLYGKLGAAYLSANVSASPNSSSIHQIRIDPAFAVGASYDLSDNVPIDLSWNRMQQIGNNSIPSIDFFAVGIAYNFGE